MEADESAGIIMKNRTERIIEEENKMKTIGLLGGMSWESTVTYYQVINETIKEKLGGLARRASFRKDPFVQCRL